MDFISRHKWVFMIVLSMVSSCCRNAKGFQAIVAKDGSGNYKTISDAINAAPNNSPTRYTIKINAGVYEERVIVGPEKPNLVFVGDGADKTIINGGRSIGSGSGFHLHDTATVDINGDHFIAMFITFNNSAGSRAQQAVALRNAAEYSAFYMCNFNGYQDTLYVDHGHQFYKKCNIFGSTDFIFGSADVVFQDCNIYVHENDIHSEKVITAQGNGSSAISIHKCNIERAPDLNPNFPKKTFLGRPWKNSTTVVYMECTMGDIIDPQGWELWEGQPPTSSIFFGEYKNKGVGSSTSGRVKWARPGGSMTLLQAQGFTVRNLIHGDSWLPATGIPFDLDLN